MQDFATNIMPSHIDQSTMSSPDPLNGSAMFSSPGKVRSSGVRRTLPVEGSSPRKQMFQLDIGNQLSPQKLLVTVEAEHSQVELGQKALPKKGIISHKQHDQPIVRQNVRTTTTTIPLKGLSDTEDDTIDLRFETPKRGRGRPRKSTGTPVPSKSRTRNVTPRATPGGRRRRTLGDLVDGDDSEDWNFEIGAGVEVGRGKGRSRTRSAKKSVQNNPTPAFEPNGSPEQTGLHTTSKQARGRKKTLTAEEFLIHVDEHNALAGAETVSEHTEADARGALAARDINLVPFASPFSTIRSNTTVGNDDPDILLAKFSPAKKTPAKTGWSSPRVALAQESSTDTASSTIPKVTSTIQTRSSSINENCNASHTSESDKSHADEDEAQERTGEFAEYDTIMESEGFSMISVDSVPSLREHLSSPATMYQVRMSSAPTAMVETTLQQGAITVENTQDLFSSTVPRTLEPTVSERKVLNHQVLKVRSANTSVIGDSFSAIPSEVLEAATPGKEVSYKNLLSVKMQPCKGDDDSFSSIPPAILEAATPAKHLRSLVISPAMPSKMKADESAPIVSMVSSTTGGIRTQNDSGLLSPEETPSPIEACMQTEPQVTYMQNKDLSKEYVNTMQGLDGSSVLSSHMRSSPPSIVPQRFTYTAHLRQQRALHPYITETPSIVFSSPSLPPLIQQPQHARTQAATIQDTNQPQRQSLSPTVRAGRVLQDIATSSPSRSRSQSLGSPFKSLAVPHTLGQISQAKFNADGAHENLQKPLKETKRDETRTYGGFSDDTRRELRKSFMLGRELARNQEGSKNTKNCITMTQREDPFDDGTQQLLSPLPEELGNYILGLPRKAAPPEASTVRSDGAMSWQPEDTIALHNSQAEYNSLAVDQDPPPQTNDTHFYNNTELLQQRREAEWARKRAVVSSQIESASTSQVIVISSDNEEEDIWQAEARHSSSILEGKPQSTPSRQELLEKPRRSKIPSPWRKNSKRLVYSDELAQLSSPLPSEKVERIPTPEVVVHTLPDHPTRVQKEPPIRKVGDEQELPDSSIVWHIPQKLNFAPRPRSSGNLDLSALLGSSPIKVPLITQQQSLKIFKPTVPLYPILDRSTGDAFSNLKKSTEEIADSTTQSYASTMGSQLETESSTTEESVMANEHSVTNTLVQYPLLPSAKSPSPQKSCLRTPMTHSPTKSVAFRSPTPPLLPLSSTEWSKKHWQLLDTIWRSYRSMPADEYGNTLVTPDDGRAEISAWLGKKVSAKGYSLVITRWHLDIAAEFAREVPGWEEGYRVKRLVALIVGEQLRKAGKAEP